MPYKNRIRAVQTIVIDEVSMVRCDLLDAVDTFCRLSAQGKNKQIPFGGKQIILVGDLGQLEPIVNGEDMPALQNRYGSTDYFFHRSDAFREGNFEHICFTQNFRQGNDGEFCNILNGIRAQEITVRQLNRLNECFCEKAATSGIFLVGNNRTADKINGEELEKLPGKAKVYRGEREGEKVDALSPDELSLKIGTHVMFTVNSGNMWQNGTMGIVMELKRSSVQVSVNGTHRQLEVPYYEWKKIHYEVDADGKFVENVTGKFRQIPLKLSWAITAHKSQGQTFDSMIIQNPNAFFGNGAKMLYTALSRARTLGNITFGKKLSHWSLQRYGIRVLA
jgi:ATP-dependent exoDNAse (exonuclease V) alpha subunit